MRFVYILFILSAFNGWSQIDLEKKTFPDYSISIPVTWTPMPYTFLDSLQALNSHLQRSSIIGFEISDSLGFNFPYFIAQFIEVKQPEGGADFDTISAIHIKKYSELGIDAEVIKNVDEARFYLEFEREGVPIFTGKIYGKNGFIDFSFYADATNRDRDFITSKQIFNSIKLNEAFVNNTSEADLKKDMGDSGKFFGIATVLFVVVGGIRWLMKKGDKEVETEQP